jgi:hypothetical protein
MGKPAAIVVLCILTFSILAVTVVRFDIKNGDEACTSVIVTGTASEGGYAILGKNRDTGDAQNKPIYQGRGADGSYARIMVNSIWMGMNEKGLAVMNTAVSALGFGGSGLGNGELNEWIIKYCQTVEEVCQKLNDTSSPIGPGKRLGGTCVGVIDRFGKGAFIEISGVGAYARFIVDSYDSEANHPRYYPGYASGPSGRDQYALDILNRIHGQEAKISYEDIIQNVTRYVHDKEQGTKSFSVSGEIPNDSTQASFVAVSGISRYDGRLSCFWGEYGNNPIVGLYIPSIVFAGNPPSESQTLYSIVAGKKSYAMNGTGYYLPERVRGIQSYTFAVEDWSFGSYEALLSTLPDGLSDAELASKLRDFISNAIEYAVNTYTTGATKSADFNEDGLIDILDALILSSHLDLQTGHPDWDPRIDLNSDGIIDIYDALVFSEHFMMRLA